MFQIISKKESYDKATSETRTYKVTYGAHTFDIKIKGEHRGYRDGDADPNFDEDKARAISDAIGELLIREEFRGVTSVHWDLHKVHGWWPWLSKNEYSKIWNPRYKKESKE